MVENVVFISSVPQASEFAVMGVPPTDAQGQLRVLQDGHPHRIGLPTAIGRRRGDLAHEPTSDAPPPLQPVFLKLARSGFGPPRRNRTGALSTHPLIPVDTCNSAKCSRHPNSPVPQIRQPTETSPVRHDSLDPHTQDQDPLKGTVGEEQKPQNRFKPPSRSGRQKRYGSLLTQNPGPVPPEHLLECTSAFSRTPFRGPFPFRCC